MNKHINDNNEQSWEIIDSKIFNDHIYSELRSLKAEINNFKEVINDIKKTNQDIKVYLERNRDLYSKALKDNYILLEKVQCILEDNRKLYMNAFKQEKEQINKLGEIASPENLLREANIKWRKNSTLPSLVNTVMKCTPSKII